jgi:phospholipid transport system substrate-binding protein
MKYQSIFKQCAKGLISGILALALINGINTSYGADKNQTSSQYSQSASTTKHYNDPVKMLNQAIVGTQKIINDQSQKLKNHPQKVVKLINQRVMPYLDVNLIAKNMLGQKWKKASQQQKQAFIKAFTKMIALVYSKSIAKVGNYQVKFRPLRGQGWKNKTYIQVSGVIFPKNQRSKTSSIVIYLKKQQNGPKKWQVYDLAFEGVSIMKNYKSQFRSINTMAKSIKAVRQINQKHQTDH